jgi:hypothetical protein
MAITTKSDMIDVQILMDVVRGKLKGKNAFIGSTLVSSGAVRVSGTMPKSGQSVIGKKIDIPYFGALGKFVQNPDGSSVTPSKLAQTLEQATIDRWSLAAEISRWARGVGAIDPALDDPYEEAANQIVRAAEVAMDEIIVAEFATTPLVIDVYDATNPVYLDWDLIQDATTLWGDEQDDIVAMAIHSQARADLAKLKDANGRPIWDVDQRVGQQQLKTFGGIPLVVSDRAPLTGSTMGAVVSSGTSPPTATLAGTPLGPWKLKIECLVSHASDTLIRFSVDGGHTWSGEIAAKDDGVAVALIDPTVDSLVGVNGQTGLTVSFASGTFNEDNVWKAQANLKVTELICQVDAGAFWYNAAALGLKSDEDILADTDITASHLYHAPKLYRRRRGGSRPGCIAIKHNVKGFIGQVTF